MTFDIGRVLHHIFAEHRSARGMFPPEALRRIEAAITACELVHTGQVRVAIEAALPVALVARGTTPRERALDVFGRLRVWDTEENCGVLVYVLLADRAVEIVADRGIHARVGDAAWIGICRSMEQAFSNRRFEQGVLEGVAAISALLVEHFPRTTPGANELPDAPLLI